MDENTKPMEPADAMLVPSPATSGALVFTRETIDLIKQVVAPDLTDMELKLFLYTAQRFNLDPLARQLYAVKRAGRMTIQTGIDGFRVVANRNGLAGIEEAIHDDEKADHPAYSKVTVYRFINGQRVPFTATARWSEYNVPNNAMWRKMPYLMLDKCAEALALRKGFPNELSGVYTTDEMMQADKPTPPAEIPTFTDDEMRAQTFKFKNGEVSLDDIMKREDAVPTLEKLFSLLSNETHKAMVKRALDLVEGIDQTKEVRAEE